MSETTKQAKIQKKAKVSRWINEPVHERHPSLLIHTKRPFVAEPNNVALQQFYTPKGQHFRKAYAPVPLIDPAKYRISIQLEVSTGNGNSSVKIKTLSMNDIKQKKRKEVSVTMMCAGNRGSDYMKFDDTLGYAWLNGSISTAKWTGCSLKQVLNDAGIFYNDMVSKGYKFVTFWSVEHYHISIPIHKAMDIDGDCILAYLMNNEPLPRDHGFPLRGIIPGFVGARSVKWIDRIVVMKQQVEGMHQTGIAYKQLPPNHRKLSKALVPIIAASPPIDIPPVTTAITAPENGSTVIRGQKCCLKGYAYVGGGMRIIRVDISLDNGKTWDQASLQHLDNNEMCRSGKTWTWTQWVYEAKIPSDVKELNVCCKAVDDHYNQQPHTAEPIWNIRGLLNASWARITLKVSGSRL
eukprot:129116_1